MVKEIKLTHEKVALVDDDDYEMLIKRSWFAAYDKKSKMWRAQSSKRVNGVTETTLMHRLITNCPRGFVVDHINGEFAHINYPKYSNNQYNPTNFNKYSNTESLLYPVRDAADLDRWMQ